MVLQKKENIYNSNPGMYQRHLLLQLLQAGYIFNAITFSTKGNIHDYMTAIQAWTSYCDYFK